MNELNEMKSHQNKNKNFWDKAQIIGTVLIPVVLAIFGFFINNTIKEKEIKLQYIEMALGILREEPSQDSIGLRLWAIDVVQKYSIVGFSEEALEELKKSALPYRKILKDTEGKIIRGTDGKPIFTR
jgi:hypothetical protein